MTKLDINAYGVQELNRQEMVETEGGLIGVILAVTALFALAGTIVVGCNNSITTESQESYENADNIGNKNTGHGTGNQVRDNASNNKKTK